MPLIGTGSYDEKALLERLAAGEENAFSAIYHRYNAMIFAAAMVYLKDVDMAQDIVQQVFVKLWERRTAVMHIENFQHYIIVSSRNLICDHFRKAYSEAKKRAELAKRQQRVSGETGSAHTEGREYARIVDNAIARLPPQQKKIYMMIEDEQLAYKEVAQVLGISRLSVKKHLELARRSVREYVSKNSNQ